MKGINYRFRDLSHTRFGIPADVVDLPVYALLQDREDRLCTVFDIQPVSDCVAPFMNGNRSTEHEMPDGLWDQLFVMLAGSVTIGRPYDPPWKTERMAIGLDEELCRSFARSIRATRV